MPSKVQFILDELNKTIEEKANHAPYKRNYLGASSIGHECSRLLWYGFRHCGSEYIDHKSKKRFEDGHYSEEVYIKRLKNAGYQLQHEEDGKQYGFSDLGGWFRGHRDGKFVNLPELNEAIWGHKCLPDDPAIWEHKSSAKWKDLEKAIEEHGEENALKKWNRIYYDQAQLYMGYDKTPWHILTCASEGSRLETIVLTPFNADDFNAIREKAKNIITSDSPPPKISDNPTFFKCKWCHHNKVCHSKAIPEPNCRNCAHITFDVENTDHSKATAVCAKHNAVIDNPDQMKFFYNCHRFNPCFIDADCLGLDGNDVLYRTEDGKDFINGDKGFNSMQMYETQETKAWLGVAGDIAGVFGGVGYVEEGKK